MDTTYCPHHDTTHGTVYTVTVWPGAEVMTLRHDCLCDAREWAADIDGDAVVTVHRIDPEHGLVHIETIARALAHA